MNQELMMICHHLDHPLWKISLVLCLLRLNLLSHHLIKFHILKELLLVYETLSGDEIRDLILKNIKPSKSFKEEDEDDGKASSALGSLGLKPKPAI